MGTSVFYVIAVIVLICLVFIIGVIIIDTHRFVVREYYFCAPHLKKNAKAVLISDLHNKVYGARNQALLKAIELTSPDYILVAGDMLTAAKGQDCRPATELLEILAERYPVYYANGNHEYRIALNPAQYGDLAERFESAVNQLPLERLRNQSIYLPNINMSVYGLDLDRSYYRRLSKKKVTVEYLNEMLGKPDKNRVNLLIAHNPEYFKAYTEWGADLVVSGHVHGGAVRLPGIGGVISPRLQLFPEYDGGLYTEKNTTMVLSRGLGTHTFPIRFMNPGELVVIHLRH